MTRLQTSDPRKPSVWMVTTLSALPGDRARAIAGGKGASLARMTETGLPVPPGFVVCAAAFEAFLEQSQEIGRIERLLHELDVHDPASLEDVSAQLRGLIADTPLPGDLDSAIHRAYRDLGDELPVAVRSSAISEDGESASFAGQQETFLNVRGAAVIAHVKDCWASFFEPRALFYRAQKGLLSDTHMAVVVQQMVQADRSGVMFTVDPIQKRRDRMVIEAVYGLGEGIVSGLLTPNHHVVDRESGTVIDEFISYQPFAIVYDAERGGTRQESLTEEQGSARVLSVSDLQHLRDLGLRLEGCFGAPQDVEWSISGHDLWLLQSRPITTL
jgi:pyruvate, water dikinase